MSQDAIMRLAIFLGLFAILAGIEHLAPRRPRPQKNRRWITNWIFVVLDTLTLRALAVILPFAAVFAAADASARGWGLLNLVALPGCRVGTGHPGYGSRDLAATFTEP